MKKISLLLALVLVLSTCSLAMAQVSLEKVFSAPGERLELVDPDMDEPLITAQKDRKHGVYNAAGELVIPFEYAHLAYKGEGLFEAIKEDGINNHALVNTKNEVVIDYLYGAFQVISADLVAAVTLEATTGEVYDYAAGLLGSGDKYLVKSYDIYQVSTKTKLGSFERADYDDATIADGHLAVRNRDDAVTIYELTNLSSVGTAKYLFDLPYEVKEAGGSYSLVGKYSGQVFNENLPYTSVALTGDRKYLITRGKDGAGLANLKGEELVPPVYDTVYAATADTGYVVVGKESLKGIADTKGKLIVPAKYTDFPMKNARLFHHSYALMELDGKLGFVNLAGEETVAPTLSKSAAHHGASLSIPDMDGSLYIIAADGTRTKTEYESFDLYFSNGLLLKGKKGNTYEVVDWHGQVLLEGLTYGYVGATKSGGYLLYEDTLYQVVDKPVAVAE